MWNINMNDNQIRQEILFDHYKSARNQTLLPSQDNNEKLKKIDKKDYVFNYAYLATHDLINASSHHFKGSATKHFTPIDGITGKGMDVVERFIDNCVESTKKTKNKIITNSLSYLEKIAELVILWSNNSDLFQQALEFLANLIR